MAIDKLSAIESVLQQMRAISAAAQAGGAGNAVSATQSGGGFAAELQRSIQQVSQAQNAASAQARAFVAGEPGVALNDVMVDMQKAGVAFQATVQVRNRLVAAYQEIASMPV